MKIDKLFLGLPNRHRPSMQNPGPYTPPPPHTPPPETHAYLAAMTPRERELHELAVKLLGSSYFVEYSHGFAQSKK
jgi:hypothetical protein